MEMIQFISVQKLEKEQPEEEEEQLTIFWRDEDRDSSWIQKTLVLFTVFYCTKPKCLSA